MFVEQIDSKHNTDSRQFLTIKERLLTLLILRNNYAKLSK